MSVLELVAINQTGTCLFAAANMQWPRMVSFDDWSDVYKVVEFTKERDELPSSSTPNNQGDGGCTFFVCLAVAAIIYFFLRI